MLTSISNFGNNAAALEKTLRLAQALSQIGASLAMEAKDKVPWVVARGQFNLSRRFFRLHKWIDCWSTAQERFYAVDENEDAVLKLLDVVKSGFLGMYFLLEMGTITNVMGITSTTWGPRLQQESNKFWFYAIATSILLSLYSLLYLPALKTTQAPQKFLSEKATCTTSDEKMEAKDADPEKTAPKQINAKNTEIYKQLIIDGCDLLIPGATVGWIPAEPLTVGIFMSISTIVAMGGMWTKIQANEAVVAAAKQNK